MEDIGLTHDDFVRMHNELSIFRENFDHISARQRLSGLLPFFKSHELFNISKYGYTACRIFGCQLVLKIVDELIYCGLNTYDRR